MQPLIKTRLSSSGRAGLISIPLLPPALRRPFFSRSVMHRNVFSRARNNALIRDRDRGMRKKNKEMGEKCTFGKPRDSPSRIRECRFAPKSEGSPSSSLLRRPVSSQNRYFSLFFFFFFYNLRRAEPLLSFRRRLRYV